VAQRCLYGVDKNPFAVNLAKLSLWLVTLAKDHPFTFLDHALKHGDSLVGLVRRQIGAFTWQPEQKESGPLFANIKGHVDAARGHREAIQALGEDDDGRKRELHREAEDAIASVRQVGDLVVAAFFAEEKDKARETRRRELDRRVQAGETVVLQGLADELRQDRNVVPFHWEIEFPEVFGRDNPGFDAIVGNPPFLGGSKISSHFGNNYLAWLLQLHPETHGNGDLVAHFFRRAFALLRDDGAFGLIATKTIAQGDTRSTGLRWLCTHGGTIFDARKRLKWPGIAAVVVSVVHVRKGGYAGTKLLNGLPVSKITAYLFHTGDDANPAVFGGREQNYFSGCKLTGDGFVLSKPEAEAWFLRDPSSRMIIRPYLGGNDLVAQAQLVPERYVICFRDWSLAEAQKWPELVAVLEKTVKIQRATNLRAHVRDSWWQFEHYRPGLYRSIASMKEVLCAPQTSKYRIFSRASSEFLFDQTIMIFLMESWSAFGLLQSRPHELWAAFFASSMKDDLRYIPSDCFETFPFPERWEQDSSLENAGKDYYEFRAALMRHAQQGLTDSYNRFHDPDERDPNILKLRELHEAMDRAVLDAYGWTDIPTACEFRLDYEEDEDSDEAPSRRKKPYRLRWPAEVHDEVLARLLDLNQKRAEAERLAGAHAEPKAAKAAPKPRRPRKDQTDSATPSLFGSDPDKETP
jgi:hypothetical protein